MKIEIKLTQWIEMNDQTGFPSNQEELYTLFRNHLADGGTLVIRDDNRIVQVIKEKKKRIKS